MTNKEIVLRKYPDAMVCEGDRPGSRIIMRPGQALSEEFSEHYWDEDGAERDAWHDAAHQIVKD